MLAARGGDPGLGSWDFAKKKRRPQAGMPGVVVWSGISHDAKYESYIHRQREPGGCGVWWLSLSSRCVSEGVENESAGATREAGLDREGSRRPAITEQEKEKEASTATPFVRRPPPCNKTIITCEADAGMQSHLPADEGGSPTGSAIGRRRQGAAAPGPLSSVAAAAKRRLRCGVSARAAGWLTRAGAGGGGGWLRQIGRQTRMYICREYVPMYSVLWTCRLATPPGHANAAAPARTST